MTINLPLVDYQVRYVSETSPPAELRPRHKARRLTLLAPILAPAAPGQPPDPTACTCDPRRWKWTRPGNLRHEPTCPRSLRSNPPR